MLTDEDRLQRDYILLSVRITRRRQLRTAVSSHAPQKKNILSINKEPEAVPLEKCFRSVSLNNLSALLRKRQKLWGARIL
jgi:hypothetical protein